MAKKLAVLISGAPEGSNLRDLEIEPGTTTRDVLKALNLEGYLLSRQDDMQPLAPLENVYESVPDGAKLLASPPAQVGQVELKT